VRRPLPAAGALLAAAVLLGLGSCVLPGSTGLHAPFSAASTASTTLLVGPGLPQLVLFGSVQVASGQLQVRLIPPHGVDAYNRTFGAGTGSISEQFPGPAEGTWTLRADSLGGTGQYDLTLKY
jgi:hypothetical protein